MFRAIAKTAGQAAAAAVLVLAPAGQSPVLAQSSPLVGQIMYVAFNFPPKGWALCNGQTLAINQNQALFSLLGTTYGGNGVNNFQLPNMQGRAPLHTGSNGFSTYILGQTGGADTATLTAGNMPAHVHTLSFTASSLPASSAAAASAAPAGNNLADTSRTLNYSASTPNVSLGSMLTVSGTTDAAGQASPLPFSTQSPYLTVTCVIALVGIFPTRD